MYDKLTKINFPSWKGIWKISSLNFSFSQVNSIVFVTFHKISGISSAGWPIFSSKMTLALSVSAKDLFNSAYLLQASQFLGDYSKYFSYNFPTSINVAKLKLNFTDNWGSTWDNSCPTQNLVSSLVISLVSPHSLEYI